MPDSHNTLKAQSFWGKRYYPAEQADDLLESVYQRLNRRHGEIDDLENRIQTLNAEAAVRQAEADALNAELNALRLQASQNNGQDALKAHVRELEKENAALRQLVTLQEKSSSDAQQNHALESERYEDKLERASIRIDCLMQTIGELKAEIHEYEKLSSGSAVAEAAQKAERIIAKAVRDSDRIIAEATQRRDGAIAASRAAYYNAIQFKINLSNCLHAAEHDLDEAIDTLRLLKYPGDSNDAMIISVAEEGEQP